MNTQKQIAQLLDRAAARAHSVNARPASSKQCWFIAGLMLKAGDEREINDIATDTSYVLTSRRASGMIDSYLAA